MKQCFKDIGRCRRNFESQHKPENIGSKIEDSANDSPGVTDPETVSKNC